MQAIKELCKENAVCHQQRSSQVVIRAPGRSRPLFREIEAEGVGRGEVTGPPVCTGWADQWLTEATDVAAKAIAQRFGTGAVDGKIQAHIVIVRA